MQLDESDKRLLNHAYVRWYEADGVLKFLSEFFREKYHLSPGDSITPSGEIQKVQLDIFGKLENGDGITLPINSQGA